MRILQICNVYPPFPHGGVGSIVVDLSPDLAGACEDFRVVGHYPASFLRQHALPRIDHSAGYPVYRFPRIAPVRPYRLGQWLARRSFALRLRALRRHFPWDIMFCDDYEGPLPHGPIGGSKLVVRLSGTNAVYDDILKRDGDPCLHTHEIRTLQQADAWIGVSKFILDATRQRIQPANHCRLEVAFNPVDCAKFAPDAEVPVSSGRVHYHNSLRPRKGIHDLMAAVPLVLKRVPHAEFHLFGSCSDFEQVKTALLQSLPLDCRNRVHIHGRIPREELKSELLKAHVACYPSHLETFGVAPVEAMACGKVTVYTNTGPGPEIIQDGVSGLLCKPGDAGSLAATLVMALEMPESTRLAMGQAARERALAAFDRGVIFTRYMEIFGRLMESKPESISG